LHFLSPHELLEGGEGNIGKFPGLLGVWKNSDTLETCRGELREVIAKQYKVILDGNGKI
jgi:hypothetical protein